MENDRNEAVQVLAKDTTCQYAQLLRDTSAFDEPKEILVSVDILIAASKRHRDQLWTSCSVAASSMASIDAVVNAGMGAGVCHMDEGIAAELEGR